jgi:hypothetical protein
MLADQNRRFRQTSCMAVCLLLLAGCVYDFYQQRTEMVKAHVEAFNMYLKADRPERAILENSQIEELASQVAESIKKRSQPPANNEMDREYVLLKTAIEAAVKNWLALGRHFTLTKKYDQARATYQRVIDTYTGDSERIYRDRAARAMADVDILSPPIDKTSGL